MNKIDFREHNDEMVRKAFRIAESAHRGQVDKAGVDYIFHPMTVASLVKDDRDCMIVALLHDVVEDTDVTFEDLSDIFDKGILDSLRLVTHEKGVPYMDYVRRIKESGDRVALRVKLADLKNNMDLSRFISVSDKDIKRVNDKYIPARKLLEE